MTLTERLLRHLPVTRSLYAALDERGDTIKKLSDPEITDLRMVNGGINIEAAGLAVERIALCMAAYVRDSGAENYVEMHVTARDAPYERYAVTVQIVGKKSPHQLREEAEAQVERLYKTIRSLEEERDAANIA